MAIAEQKGDPSAKKMLERVLTRVVTPGVPWDADGLDSKEKVTGWWVYILKTLLRVLLGIAALDVSTGEFLVTELPTLVQTIAREFKGCKLKNSFCRRI